MKARIGEVTKGFHRYHNHITLFSILALLTIILFCNPVSATWYNVYPNNYQFNTSIDGWSSKPNPYTVGSGGAHWLSGWSGHDCAEMIGWVGTNQQIRMNQTFNFRDAQYLIFDSWRYGTGVLPSNVYIDGVNIFTLGTPTDTWTTQNVSIPSQYRSGTHTLGFGGDVTGSSYPVSFKVDNVYLKTENAGNPSGTIIASAGMFEFGKWGTYTVDISNGINNTLYYVDVYGKNVNGYTYLFNESFTHLTSYPENTVVITAPAMSAGYEQLYAVLRTAENYSIDNTTDPLVADVDNYFAWVPSVVGYDETTKLIYGYNYSGKFYYDADYEIQNVYNWAPDNLYVGNLQHSIVVDNLNNVSSGEYSYTAPNLSYYNYEVKNGRYTGHNGTVYPKEYRKYTLYRNEWREAYQETMFLDDALLSATLLIDPDKKEPTVPNYVPQYTPQQQSEITPDNPELPPQYKPPEYPHPSNPHDETEEEGGEQVPNPDYDPAYQPNTTYDPETHTWNYDNTSAYNGTDGYFPVDIPGNTSPDTSRFQGFYTFVDDVYSPANKTVFGFLNFVLSPITSLYGYINSTSNYFDDASEDLVDQNFIGEVFVPIFNAIPDWMLAIMIFSLSLTILSFVLKGR